MSYYSIVAFATRPFLHRQPVIAMDTGVNVISLETDDIDGVVRLLKSNGIDVKQVNCLNQTATVNETGSGNPEELPDDLATKLLG